MVACDILLFGWLEPILRAHPVIDDHGLSGVPLYWRLHQRVTLSRLVVEGLKVVSFVVPSHLILSNRSLHLYHKVLLLRCVDFQIFSP